MEQFQDLGIQPQVFKAQSHHWHWTHINQQWSPNICQATIFLCMVTNYISKATSHHTTTQHMTLQFHFHTFKNPPLFITQDTLHSAWSQTVGHSARENLCQNPCTERIYSTVDLWWNYLNIKAILGHWTLLVSMQFLQFPISTNCKTGWSLLWNQETIVESVVCPWCYWKVADIDEPIERVGSPFPISLISIQKSALTIQW